MGKDKVYMYVSYISTYGLYVYIVVGSAKMMYTEMTSPFLLGPYVILVAVLMRESGKGKKHQQSMDGKIIELNEDIMSRLDNL